MRNVYLLAFIIFDKIIFGKKINPATPTERIFNFVTHDNSCIRFPLPSRLSFKCCNSSCQITLPNPPHHPRVHRILTVLKQHNHKGETQTEIYGLQINLL